jgi:hypothetical protein
VDKITFSKNKKKFKRGAGGFFGGKEGRDALFLTGIENTA